jgi:hypothetical protein
MMYAKQFAVAIKSGGKILRENQDEVYLPFCAEFAVVAKNLSNRRAQFRVTIDGREAATWVILGPNQSIELERFLKDNLLAGNKFKFIERTAEVENHRGVKIDDGVVRVEYKFESVNQYTTVWNSYQGGLGGNYSMPSYQFNVSNTGGADLDYGEQIRGGMLRSTNVNMAETSARAINTAGITVPGGLSNQTFTTVSDFSCDATEVIVLRLKGQSGETKVHHPVTVQKKPVCTSCGRTNKATHDFCSGCGTALQLFG